MTDISICQGKGKKIFISIGGASTAQFISSDTSATNFGQFLWKAFGPYDANWVGPRPFGELVVDGFDLDIESTVGGDTGYQALAQSLRTNMNTYNALSTATKKIKLSAAPQCLYQDAALGKAIANVAFDYL